jgi:hypothetical protein
MVIGFSCHYSGGFGASGWTVVGNRELRGILAVDFKIWKPGEVQVSVHVVHQT